MPLFTDFNIGNHHGQRSRYIFDGNELDIGNATILAGGVVSTQNLYAPGFANFSGQLDITTAVSTTAEIRVQPILENNIFLADDEFTVATITTGTPARLRYTFYWGEARGLLTGALFSSSYCFSAAFRLRVRNTGANTMNLVSMIGLECVS